MFFGPADQAAEVDHFAVIGGEIFSGELRPPFEYIPRRFAVSSGAGSFRNPTASIRPVDRSKTALY